MGSFSLDREKTGLLIVDVQEKLFPKMERVEELYRGITKIVRGFKAMDLPIIVSEQYPEGLGQTIPQLRSQLGDRYPLISKTTFSCMADADCRNTILDQSVTQWVVVGIEAHVCILQTARDLVQAGKEVVIVNDAIGSRSIYDFSSAIAEARDCGARVSSIETVLFELIRDSKAPEFKEISRLVQCVDCKCSC